MLRSAWVFLQRLLTREPLYCNTCKRGTDTGLNMYGNYSLRCSCQVIYACWSLMLLCVQYTVTEAVPIGSTVYQGLMDGSLMTSGSHYLFAKLLASFIRSLSEVMNANSLAQCWQCGARYCLLILSPRPFQIQEGKSIICKAVNNFIVAFF